MKKIFKSLLIIISFALAFASCQKEADVLGTEISVDVETLAFAGAHADEQVVNLRADGEWVAVAPSWLNVVPPYGSGSAVVKIIADDNIDEDGTLSAARNGVMTFEVADMTVSVAVSQEGDPDKAPEEIKEYTIKEILAFTDADKGRTVRVGGNITEISNPKFGEFTIADEEGNKLLIYNTVKSGSYAEFKPAAGDYVLCEGPFTIYNGTYELGSPTTILEIKRSLFDLPESSFEGIAKEGEEVKVPVLVKGQGLKVTIEEAAASWITYIGTEPGEEKGYENLIFSVAANELGARTAKITLSTVSEGETSSITVTFVQNGAVEDIIVADILKKEDGLNVYRVTGIVSQDTGSEYGNIYVKDYSGEIYVYGVLDTEGQSKQWSTMGIKVGDIVTVEGPKTSWNDTPQMKNVTIHKHIAVTPVTVAEFTGKEDSEEVYYSLTGKVADIVMDKNDPSKVNVYGNFDLVDDSGTIYVHGLLSGWGGPSKQFESMNIKEGDEITIIGTHASYEGSPQVGRAFLVTHKPAGEGGEEGGETTPPEGGEEGGETTPPEGGEETPDVQEEKVIKVFSNTIPDGEQYKETTHEIGEGVSLTAVECHWKSDHIRMYSNTEYDGYIYSTKFPSAITKITFNAGNKADVMNVYGSTDGTNWTLVKGEDVIAEYSDHTVEFPADTYTYFKMDVAGTQQVRIKALDIYYK